VRKISFLLALVLTLVVAGVASASPENLAAADLNAGIVTITDLAGWVTTTTPPEVVVITGAAKLNAAGWENLDTVTKAWIAAGAGRRFTLTLNPATDEIPDNALKDNTAITQIVANTAVKKIGNSAFEGAGNFTAFNIAAGSVLESIGANAFKGTKIAAFSAANALNFRSIGVGAFENARSLAMVTLGGNNQLKEIPANAFKGCDAAAFEVLLPPTIHTIGASAFEGANFTDAGGAAAHTFTLPIDVRTIGEAAFKDSTDLDILVIPASHTLTTIGASAFEGSDLNQIGATAGTLDFIAATALTTIGDNAFKDLRINHVTNLFETALTTIGAGAFEDSDLNGAGGVWFFEIPETVTRIGARAFAVANTLGAAGDQLSIVLRAGTTTAAEPTTLAEVAAILSGIGMTDAFRGIPTPMVGGIFIADRVNDFNAPVPPANPQPIDLGDLIDALLIVDDPDNADTQAIVAPLVRAGLTTAQIVTVCSSSGVEILSPATVNAIASTVATTPPGGSTPPGGGTTPPAGGSGGSGGGGCATGAVLPFAAMLALGLVKRKGGK
jgi:hypothetical protein